MPPAEGVLFAGGGTGGHVLPGLAVAEALRRRGEMRLRWIGDGERIEAKLVPAAGIPLLPIGLSRPRLSSPRWLLAAACRAVACLREMVRRPPAAVLTLGGYAALLPGLCATLLRRPVVALEQNAHPGRTNRLLSRFARATVVQFSQASALLPNRRVVVLGNPVRRIAAAPRGREARLRVLVMGGSLAAATLNDLLLAAAPRLDPAISIVHLAGEAERARVAAVYAAAGVDAEVHGFFADMPALYRRIDLAVARAGATTVAELCAAGIAAFYVPLPWAADDHQTANAEAVARIGGAVVLAQASANGVDLAARLNRCSADRDLVERMGLAARSLARPGAAAAVAELVVRVGSVRRRRAAKRAAVRAAHRLALLSLSGGTR